MHGAHKRNRVTLDLRRQLSRCWWGYRGGPPGSLAWKRPSAVPMNRGGNVASAQAAERLTRPGLVPLVTVAQPPYGQHQTSNQRGAPRFTRYGQSGRCWFALERAYGMFPPSATGIMMCS
jgi:hypothetical protein